MKPMLLAAAFGVLVAAPLAQAQQSSRSPDPSDPAVTVPQPVYESAMTGYSRQPREGGATPDKTWRQANEAVAAAPGHAAHGVQQPQAPAQPDKPAPADHKHH